MFNFSDLSKISETLEKRLNFGKETEKAPEKVYTVTITAMEAMSMPFPKIFELYMLHRSESEWLHLDAYVEAKIRVKLCE